MRVYSSSSSKSVVDVVLSAAAELLPKWKPCLNFECLFIDDIYIAHCLLYILHHPDAPLPSVPVFTCFNSLFVDVSLQRSLHQNKPLFIYCTWQMKWFRVWLWECPDLARRCFQCFREMDERRGNRGGRKCSRQNDGWSRHGGGMFGGCRPRFPSEGLNPTGSAFSHPPLESSSPSPPLCTSHPCSPAPSLIFPLFPPLFIALPSPDTPPSVSALPFLLAALLPLSSTLSRRRWQNFPGKCCADEPPEPPDTHTDTHAYPCTEHMLNGLIQPRRTHLGRGDGDGTYSEVCSRSARLTDSFTVPRIASMYICKCAATCVQKHV